MSPTSKRVFFPPTLAAKFTRSTVLNCDNPFSLGSKFATGLFKRYPLRASQICGVIALKSEYISLQQKVKQIFLSIGLTGLLRILPIHYRPSPVPSYQIDSWTTKISIFLSCPLIVPFCRILLSLQTKRNRRSTCICLPAAVWWRRHKETPCGERCLFLRVPFYERITISANLFYKSS